MERNYFMNLGPDVKRDITVSSSGKKADSTNQLHGALNKQSSRGFWASRTATITQETAPLDEVPNSENDSIEARLSLWKERLKGTLAISEFPTDRPRAVVQTFCGAAHHFPIEEKCHHVLGAFCDQQNICISAAALAAFKVLLFRYTGQDDLIVGELVGNREKTTNGITSIPNAHVLRTAMRSEMTFRELVAYINEQQVETLKHSIPLQKLIEAVQPDHKPEQTPFFQFFYSFSLQNGTLSIAPENHSFDLWLKIKKSDTDLTCSCEYNRDLFDNETISRVAAHFQTLLAAAAENPSQPISVLPLLSRNERQQILFNWNKTQADYPNTCVHSLFSQQAAKTPNQTAIEFKDASLTYTNLESRANQLAHYLKSIGVGSETLVGLCVNRSAEMVVAILAILKAGGTYIPLDPAFPTDRLAFMVEDSQMPVLLTETNLQDLIPTKGVRKICLDEEADIIAKAKSTPPEPIAHSQSLAYVLYTSGSTGKPKGVQITHSAVVNFLISMQQCPGLTANDRLLAITTLSFDIAGLELFLPLITGATVVIAPREVSADGIRLAEQIEKMQITVMQGTPATWRILLQSGWKGCSRLKILCGGEALPIDLAEALLPRCAELWNLYGPTETTIWSSVIRVRAGERIIVGPPIANTQFYIVDEQLQLVPIGVAGELCIGGDGLARGYLNRSELTTEKFITDPFSGQPGAKIYRTGDLARFRRDGGIEFLGRKDHQVKVRGFRIELGEIETALAQHPSLQQNVVVAREDAPGEKRLVAYCILRDESIATGDLRKFLSERLPEYMIPSAFVPLENFPLTPNGKIDRRALPAPDVERPEINATYIPPRNDTEKTIARIWEEVLNLKKVGIHDNFFELGGYSLLLVKVHSKLRKAFSKPLPMVEMFRYSTVESLARFFRETELPKPAPPQPVSIKEPPQQDSHLTHQNSIAIVGMAGRFPGAKNIVEFWENLRNGIESIFPLTDDELLAKGVSPEELKSPNYVKLGTDLHAYDQFDASFFGFNPREAEITDPQQRIFLETAWEALESAGCSPDSFTGRIGVFAGSSLTSYLFNLLNNHSTRGSEAFQAIIGNDKDYLATRLSYKLNLRGPSFTVQTACSTSLVAVHLACQSLLNGECEAALAGGVSAHTDPRTGYMYQEGMILSPDGHCRPFDAKAQGTFGGIGIGIVVLKRLSDALTNGDTIHAVIRGTAINNDGAQKVGFTAPSISGQAEVVSMAQAAAEVDPATITYIEAHGTATELGDPIEVAALSEAFRSRTDKKQFCAIGSVKSNVGHLDTAAGVAGLIKVVLALKYKQIPPSLHFNKPNPKIDFENSPFYVNTRLQDWKLNNGTPRRAAVSSFGIGGTNAHAVLEEAPPHYSSEKSRPHQLLLLSAKTKSALRTTVENLAKEFKQHAATKLADAAFTLQTGRKHFQQRAYCIASNTTDAGTALGDSRSLCFAGEEPRDRKIVFLFSGQGSQHLQMGAELYENEKVFRDTVDQCAELLRPKIQHDLRDLIFNSKKNEAVTRQLNQTAFAQPALFMIEYALAKLWMSWGIQPEAMLGHSIGEYVAACLAGVFTLEDALSLVAERGRLMQELPEGSMLAVPLSEKDIQPLLNDQVALAASNGPSLNVLAGPTQAIETLEAKLSASGLNCRRLHTSHAFHSPMMEPVLKAFTECVRNVSLNPPALPYISNLTGTWIKAEEATDPTYWAHHLRHAVRFSSAIQELSKDTDRIFLEVGPGQALTALTKLHSNGRTPPHVFSSLGQFTEKNSDEKHILSTLGALWALGVKIDWNGFYAHEKRLRIPLPTYPFERQRYWIDAPKEPQTVKTVQPERADFEQWFYLPSWKRAPIDRTSARQAASQRMTWLLFVDSCGLGENLARQLRHLGQVVTTVSIGNAFSKTPESNFIFNPSEGGDYKKLFEALSSIGRTPDRIVHLWAVTSPKAKRRPSLDSLKVPLELNFYSLLHIGQVIREQMPGVPVQLKVVCNQLQAVTGDEELYAEKSSVLGPCRVIPQENQNVQCACIDVVLPELKKADKFNELLLDELFAKVSESVVAHRGEHRWVQTFEPVKMQKDGEATPVLRHEGVYFITGGLGGIGFVLAEYFARTAKAKLVLTGRTKLPPRQEWESWLEKHDKTNTISRSIEKVESLERLGAEVTFINADVANWQGMKRAISEAENRYGKINGVIHAAGVAGGGVIDLKTREAAHRVLCPKIHGTLALQQALENRQLDFFVLCSSINAVLGGVGQVDYCTANAFLDAFAYQHHSRNVFSINWYAWQEVGMAVNTEVPQNLRAEREKVLRLGIKPNEGIEAFTRILEHRLPQVIVSPENFNQLVEHEFKQSLNSHHNTNRPDKHSRPSVANDYVPPKTEMEKVLAGLWQEVLGIEKIGGRDDFFQLGGHSLLGLTLFAKIKAVTGKEMPLSFLFEAPTVEKMAAVLGDDSSAIETKSKRSQIIVPIKPKGTRSPFFCIHGVGGAVIEYSHLARYMDPEQPVFGIQAQGLDGKEPWLKTIEEMADRYLEEIKQVQAKGPYRLGGSSFGGIVAFEIAQRLLALGESVDLLAFFDSYGGDYPRPLQTANRFKTKLHKATARFDMHFTNLRLLEMKDWPAYIREKAGRLPLRWSRRFKKLKQEVRFLFLPRALRNQFKWTGDDGGELWHFKLPKAYSAVADLNVKSTLGYRYKPYPGNAVLFRATKQPQEIEPDETNGWGSLIQGKLRIIEVPGYHGAIIREPLVRNLAPKLNELLE